MFLANGFSGISLVLCAPVLQAFGTLRMRSSRVVRASGCQCISHNQGVTKRCRLSWLTNRRSCIWAQMQGEGGRCGISANEYRSQLDFRDLTPYLTYGRNSPGFDPSILRHSGIWRAADEAVWNNVHKKKKQKNPHFRFDKKFWSAEKMGSWVNKKFA